MSDDVDVRHDDAPARAARDSDERVAAAGLPKGGEVLARSETIARPRAELYAFYRDFTNLPLFMDDVVRIDLIDATRSHWVVKGLGDDRVEWDARIIEDVSGESLAWTSEDSDAVSASGSVAFRDAGSRGTIVTSTIAYDPPAGMVGKLVARFFGKEPGDATRHDLRRFKQLMETGEITVSARNKALALAEKD